jgi:hypothetical protein
MRLALLFPVLAVAVQIGGPKQETKPGPVAAQFVAIDLYEARKKNLEGDFNVRVGDLIQYYVITTRKTDEALRTYKVELKGDAIELVTVVEVPVFFHSTQPTKQPPRPDLGRKNLSCFLKAAREGKAVVKITPVGEDGKDQPMYEIPYRVLKQLPPEPPRK